MKRLILFFLMFACPLWAEQMPLQFGMAFRCGDAKSPVIRGVNTQITVKNTCPDGTVKFAVVNAVIDGKPGDKPKLDWIEGVSVGGSRPMPALDITMQVTTPIDGKVYTYNAQQLPAHIWLDGLIATSVRYADYKAQGQFRPIFEVTHWHTLQKTMVRFIGENTNTEAVAELWQDITLKINGQIVYHKDASPFPRASRWTKTIWINGPPTPITPKYDLNYLKATGLIPNYITNLTPPATQIDQLYQQWLDAAKDLGDPGNLQKAMGAAGARAELGPLPTWTTLFLFTGDKRMLEMARGNADLGASFPMHYREGNSAKSFYGLPLSIWDRPSIMLLNIDYPSTSPADRVQIIGDPDQWGWNPDVSHVPDLSSALYIATGEEFYLEELEFWASYAAGYYNGAAVNNKCGRGPTGAEGGMPGAECVSIRGQAWNFRLRALAAVLMPDDRALEKSYYDKLTRDAINIWEGERNINPRTEALWTWGRTINDQATNNPAHRWEKGNGSFAQDPIDGSKVSTGISTWEENFLEHNLQRGAELGFPTQALSTWHKVALQGTAAVDYRLEASYRMPVLLTDGTPATFAQLPSLYLPGQDWDAIWTAQTRADHGYGFVAKMAGINGPISIENLSNNVKWAILPR